MIHIFSPKGGE